MACKLPNKDAYSNSRDFLLDNQAMDNTHRILDLERFEELVDELETQAEALYGLGGRFWEAEKGYARANTDLLTRLDDLRNALNLYDKQEAKELNPNQVGPAQIQARNLPSLIMEVTGKCKAAKGVHNGFTRGGRWEVEKDFKGMPRHRDGGVDIVVRNGEVYMSNGKSEVRAKKGLVICGCDKK